MIRRPPRSTLFPTRRSSDLDFALQQEALKAAGCEKVYAEKISGARSDRPQLARMLKTVGPGDTVIVTRLDRSEEHTSELQSHSDLVCRLLLEKKKETKTRLQ